MSSESKTAWDQLAQTFANSRQVSADKLIEWSAQLRLSSPFVGKRVLDVGCGTGEKANHFFDHGAASVLAVDPSEGYSKDWNGRQSTNLIFRQGDFQNLHKVVGPKTFDLIVCFQALMYADDLNIAVQTMTDLLRDGGILTVSVPHPFRFAIMRNEIEGWPLGAAYQRVAPYSYPSPCDCCRRLPIPPESSLCIQVGAMRDTESPAQSEAPPSRLVGSAVRFPTRAWIRVQVS